jgi:hypothetical protein
MSGLIGHISIYGLNSGINQGPTFNINTLFGISSFPSQNGRFVVDWEMKLLTGDAWYRGDSRLSISSATSFWVEVLYGSTTKANFVLAMHIPVSKANQPAVFNKLTVGKYVDYDASVLTPLRSGFYFIHTLLLAVFLANDRLSPQSC